MALSGSKTVAFCSRKGANRFYLKWTWSATEQSISGNYSTVTVKGYIGSYGNGYSISSSASKSGTLTINGTSYSFSSSTAISSGGSRQIVSKTVQVNHNSDGTKNFAINMSFNPAVTISGTYQGSKSMGSTTYTLNTIPRESSFTLSGGWKFPNNKTISISRKSSALTSTVRIYIAGQSSPLKTWTGTSSTSFSTSFTDDENKKILQAINSNDKNNISVRYELDTMSGTTKIGSTKTATGTISYYGRSTTTFTNSLNIGGTISGKITENHADYRHKIELLQSNGSTVIHTMLNTDSTSNSWSYTPTASGIYKLCPNSNSYSSKIKITTYYKTTGVTVGSPATGTITFKVPSGNNPTFNPTMNYTDRNSTVTAITGGTGNNPTLVQNQSQLRVTLSGISSSTLSAKNSATVSKLQVTVAGVTKSANYSSSATSYNFDFGKVNASSNQSASIVAIDSRGNKTSKALTIKFVPYTAPKLVAKVERANKFSRTVNVDVSGSFSLLTIDGEIKNSIPGAYYTYGVDGGTIGNKTNINLLINGSNCYMTAPATFTLVETSIATVKVTLYDALGSTTTVTVSVPTGLPIFFVDAEKGNVSFNSLPDMDKESHMTIGMNITCAKGQWWDFEETASVGRKYAINLNNSDVVGGNAIVMGDASNLANNEGIFFPNSGCTYETGMPSPTFEQCTRIYAIDGQLWLADTGSDKDTKKPKSGNPTTCIGRAGRETPLWEGAWYMNASQSITLSGTKSLYNQPNGWILCWSDYNATGDNAGAQNSDWVFTYVPKQIRDYANIKSKTVLFSIPRFFNSTIVSYTIKALSFTNTTINGHASNFSEEGTNSNDVVLRAVFGY